MIWRCKIHHGKKLSRINMSNQGKDFNSVVAQEDSDSSESDNETPAAAAAPATVTLSIFDSDSSESDAEPPKLERSDTPVSRLSFSELGRTSPPTLQPMECAKGGQRSSGWIDPRGPYHRVTRSSFPRRGRAAPSAAPAESVKKEASPKG
ncbi:hypothetical protein LSTR_LSTR015294 [Laodelphax striatellus]|uniref:Uncharacterized protein n=1 Tax=Laodelphax striatellus TaxID=195883 RepID=A0A482WT98_LAOST|nr:hypothetical protein LSTR_LSTR015294 [Laodelphax striatellus]